MGTSLHLRYLVEPCLCPGSGDRVRKARGGFACGQRTETADTLTLHQYMLAMTPAFIMMVGRIEALSEGTR